MIVRYNLQRERGAMQNKLLRNSSEVERTIIELAAQYAPILAPIGPIYFIVSSAIKYYHAPWWIAVLMAIGIEAVGILTTDTTMAAWVWNQTKGKNDKRIAPTWISILMIAGYGAVGIMLAIGLDIAAGVEWQKASAKAIMFLLVVIAYITMAVRHQVIGWTIDRDKNRVRTKLDELIKKGKTELETIEEQSTQLAQEQDNLTLEITGLTDQRTKLAEEIKQLNMAKRAGQNGDLEGKSRSSLNSANQSRQARIAARQADLAAIYSADKTHAEMVEELKHLDHKTSVSTLKNDLKQMNGLASSVVRNGNGKVVA